MTDYITIKANEGETEDTVKFRVFSQPMLKEKFLFLSQILGWVMTPASYKLPLNLTKTKDGYTIHSGHIDNPFFGKIKISNIKLEFLPETIKFDSATSSELNADTLTSTVLINNGNSDTKFKKTFSFTHSNKTTISSNHKIANGLSLKRGYSIGVPNLFSAGAEISFNFSHEYNFGNQKETLEVSESLDEFSLILPPKTKIPLKLIVYSSKTKLPFIGLARVFYNLTIDGPLSLRRSAHISLNSPYSNDDRTIPFSYTFGNNNLSAEESIQREENNKNPNGPSWNWKNIQSEYKRLESLGFSLDYFKKGFAVELNGVFSNSNTKNINIEADSPIPI